MVMLERSWKVRMMDMNEYLPEPQSESPSEVPVDGGHTKNPAAVALGRLGGKKGGKARAMKLSAERRTEIARKAAMVRWNKNG